MESKAQSLAAARLDAAVPVRGWLRAVREAVGLTQLDVALKAGVKRQSYAQFENAEERGSISISSLRRAAEAMDCELVYFVLPREVAARSYMGLAGIKNPSARHLSATDHSMEIDGRPDADEAR